MVWLAVQVTDAPGARVAGVPGQVEIQLIAGLGDMHQPKQVVPRAQLDLGQQIPIQVQAQLIKMAEERATA